MNLIGAQVNIKTLVNNHKSICFFKTQDKNCCLTKEFQIRYGHSKATSLLTIYVLIDPFSPPPSLESFPNLTRINGNLELNMALP